MKKTELRNAVFYNAELDELYVFDNKYFQTVYLLGWGTIWHHIGEL